MKKRALVAAAVCAMSTVGVVGGVAAYAAKPADPSGNNGTVKIDRLAFDDEADNQPHVGCTFQVDFYGYDEGDYTATVTFTAKAPTLPAQGSAVLLTDKVFIGEDSAAGGGSTAGLDASKTYQLDVSAIAPHPKQGVHVELTVNAPGSRGADVKHKVFWVTGCGTTPSPSPSPSVSPSPSPSMSPSPSPSMSPSPSASVSPTVSPSPSVSPTPYPSASPSPSGSPSPTVTPSPSVTVSPSPSVTVSPTATPSPSHY